MSTSLLSFREVSKTYQTPAGPYPVLKAVDFDMQPGEFVALTGPSGSGKSTFLNLAAFLDCQTEGEIRFQDQLVGAKAERIRRRLRRESVGMIFQSFHLLMRQSAFENVLFGARYAPSSGAKQLRERARELMAEFSLETIADSPARFLSGGEMQRVAIARSMMVPRELLLADEPTGNLDRASAEVVMQQLVRIQEAGVGVLLVTHNESLLDYSSRHIRCDEGQLIEAP